jgi:hypothetical protein
MNSSSYKSFARPQASRKLMYVGENIRELPNYLKLCHAYRQATSISICISSSVTLVIANVSQSDVT